MKTESISKHFFTGINYFGSAWATQMWSHYDEASVEDDMKRLSDAGITHLRVFPIWSDFQPLHALYASGGVFEYRFGEEPLPDTPAGRAGVSEEMCEHFAHFCRTARKYGLGLIVALITGGMSYRLFVPQAFEGRNLMTDPTVIKWQIRFVRYFVGRFREEKAIVAWDLGNEVGALAASTKDEVGPDDFYLWSAAIAGAVKSTDTSRPLVSGIDKAAIGRGVLRYEALGENCDINTVHPYSIFATPSEPIGSMLPLLNIASQNRLSEDLAGIPTFPEEFGAIGYMNCSLSTEAAFYRAALLVALSHGCHGTMWWCAFDQGHLPFAPYDWNNIGSDYGFFDKNGNAKPIVAENLAFRGLLSALPDGDLPPARRDGVILCQRDEPSFRPNVLLSTFALGKRAGLDLGFADVLGAIPDAPLYIFPSVTAYHAIPGHRLEELLSKVRDGAVLYVSIDTELFRRTPEIFGFECRYRRRVSGVKNVIMDGTSYPIGYGSEFSIEPRSAEVLARDENGEPVFLVNSFGKGKVIFSAMALERYLLDRDGAFFREDEPDYAAFYRVLSREAGICRAVGSSSPFIRLTEHPLPDGRAYITAINYSMRRETTRLDVKKGTLREVWGAPLHDSILDLEPDSGAIFLYEK